MLTLPALIALSLGIHLPAMNQVLPKTLQAANTAFGEEMWYGKLVLALVLKQIVQYGLHGRT